MIELTTHRVDDRPLPHPFQLAVRIAMVTAALAAVGSTRAAAGEPVLVLEVAVVALAGVCAILPDSHTGLLVIALVGINWLVTVDDPTNAWVLGVAASTALFHTSMSAASVSPAAARWTPAMRRRWGRRCAVQAAVAAPAWLMVTGVARAEIGGSAVVMAGALAAIAVGALWAAHDVMRSGDSSGA